MGGGGDLRLGLMDEVIEEKYGGEVGLRGEIVLLWVIGIVVRMIGVLGVRLFERE